MDILFVTDLDGTFVKNSVTVSNSDLESYKEIIKLGDFAIATGRSIKEINYIVSNYNLDVKYSIAFNGAVVEKGNKIIFDKKISKDTLSEVLEYLKNKKLTFDALDGVSRIGNFQHEKAERLWNMPLICEKEPFNYFTNREVYKINIRPRKDERDLYYNDLINKFKNIEVAITGDTRIEITAEKISKASSLKKIKENYNKVVVFGDSGNDVDMFLEADISYCMSSAPLIVQEKATHVVEDFATAIEHYKINYL